MFVCRAASWCAPAVLCSIPACRPAPPAPLPYSLLQMATRADLGSVSVYAAGAGPPFLLLALVRVKPVAKAVPVFITTQG